MLKRHEVEILLKAGHSKAEVARLTGVSLCSVKRIDKVQVLGGYAQMDPYYVPYTMKAPMTGHDARGVGKHGGPHGVRQRERDDGNYQFDHGNLTMGSLDD